MAKGLWTVPRIDEELDIAIVCVCYLRHLTLTGIAYFLTQEDVHLLGHFISQSVTYKNDNGQLLIENALHSSFASFMSFVE